MYVLDAYGWRLTLGPYANAVAFWKLLAVRTAGEVVNMTTPTAYVGGEPLKAYLLKRYGVPMVDGLASVVIAKTTMTIAQIIFILIGLASGFWLLGAGGSPGQTIVTALLSAGHLAFGVGGFVLVQRGEYSPGFWRCSTQSASEFVFSSHAGRSFSNWIGRSPDFMCRTVPDSCYRRGYSFSDG